MSYGTKCQEEGCKNYAKHQIRIVLRSRPTVEKMVSNPVAFVCDQHNNQTFNEFVSDLAWNSLILKFRAKGSPLPVRCVSYIVSQPFKDKIPY